MPLTNFGDIVSRTLVTTVGYVQRIKLVFRWFPGCIDLQNTAMYVNALIMRLVTCSLGGPDFWDILGIAKEVSDFRVCLNTKWLKLG